MPKQPILALRGRELFKGSRGHRRTGREGPAQDYAVPKAPVRFTMEPQRLHRLAFEANPCQESPPPLDDALALNRDDPKILRRLAESCLGQGELDQALDHFRRIAELCPQSATAHTDLALTEERLGDLPAAAKSYRRALALDPGSPGALPTCHRFTPTGRSARGAAAFRERRGPRPGPLRVLQHSGHCARRHEETAGGDRGFPEFVRPQTRFRRDRR